MGTLTPLQQDLLKVSAAESWGMARLEWRMIELWQEQDGTCLCGHTPITDHCLIENQITKAQEVVGNCCVKQFLGQNYSDAFAAVRRLRENPHGSTPMVLIALARRYGWLTAWEVKFADDTFGKRKLSDKQRDIRERINRKLVQLFKQRPKVAN
ncbi:MAG: hypothetical protein RJA29_2068 [Pseudomonadota bacterium]|jgi:hypothetical protein